MFSYLSKTLAVLALFAAIVIGQNITELNKDTDYITNTDIPVSIETYPKVETVYFDQYPNIYSYDEKGEIIGLNENLFANYTSQP